MDSAMMRRWLIASFAVWALGFFAMLVGHITTACFLHLCAGYALGVAAESPTKSTDTKEGRKDDT